MKLLILGGTRFLGRFLTETALQNGHEVTLFNRGKTEPELFPEVEKLIGDRNGDLEALRGRSWDAVIDPSGYLPWSVQESAELLTDSAGHYTFISSASVYDQLDQPDIDENHSVGKLPQERIEELKAMEPAQAIAENYGELKYLCEKEVERVFTGRSLIVRPGLIVGPFDFTDRFSYWVNRIAKGGEVLAPGRRDKEIQFIDVRDLAEWIIRMVESKVYGTYNATGPATELTMEEFLDRCKETVGDRVDIVWVEEKFLLGHEVNGWTDMPLWIPDSANMPGFLSVNIQKAMDAGLKFRPLKETILDTLKWESSRSVTEKKAGLDPAKEKAVLKDWNEKGL
ncbi:SDR family oxidoreductase [Planococcus halotolerans]|uniref:NAD-dependent epimerase/dehydratase domain-containing protein n=1 Tax=Planococcus halotolerans TaxID=2233542 RepID=A0A365KXG2_9BACL|nr:SDR family oxidoreductase [Planococcus halotolerans]QHJ72164.1 NAD-dependent epimerase/dehydratase family protein [Planococcus halotolerans]RAZ77820.1 hypothetical protein DP120_10090 [Planococcus halotolerans]